eukprot:1138266-Amphidinium_carterae.1
MQRLSYAQLMLSNTLASWQMELRIVTAIERKQLQFKKDFRQSILMTLMNGESFPGMDVPARERHEAQVAASQAMETSGTADAASASDNKKILPTRGKSDNAKQIAKPIEPLEGIPEGPQASEAGSYHSAEEVDADHEAEAEETDDE